MPWTSLRLFGSCMLNSASLCLQALGAIMFFCLSISAEDLSNHTAEWNHPPGQKPCIQVLVLANSDFDVCPRGKAWFVSHLGQMYAHSYLCDSSKDIISLGPWNRFPEVPLKKMVTASLVQNADVKDKAILSPVAVHMTLFVILGTLQNWSTLQYRDMFIKKYDVRNHRTWASNCLSTVYNHVLSLNSNNSLTGDHCNDLFIPNPTSWCPIVRSPSWWTQLHQLYGWLWV